MPSLSTPSETDGFTSWRIPSVPSGSCACGWKAFSTRRDQARKQGYEDSRQLEVSSGGVEDAEVNEISRKEGATWARSESRASCGVLLITEPGTLERLSVIVAKTRCCCGSRPCWSPPDGRSYRSRHDPSRTCAAIFHRAARKATMEHHSVRTAPQLGSVRAALVNSYHWGLINDADESEASTVGVRTRRRRGG